MEAEHREDRAGMSVGPRYEKIEFCRRAETLWGKLEEGRWDWLGVHPDGQFVLGSPPASRVEALPPGIVVSSASAPPNQSGVTIQEPTSPSSGFWMETAEEAESEFERHFADASTDDVRPRVVRLRLYQDSRITREEFIVHRPSTYR
jgi:hypothetical protein